MGLYRVVRGTAVCLLVAVFGVLPAQAQQANPRHAQSRAEPRLFQLGILNIEEIDQKAKVFVSIRAQMEKYRSSFEAAIKSEEDELRKADKELARQRTILSADAYAEQRRKFEKRVADFQHKAQTRRQNLNVVFRKAMAEANGRLKRIVEKFAQENNVSLILRSDLVAYYVRALDLTGPVLEQLDKTLPSVKVPKPEQ